MSIVLNDWKKAGELSYRLLNYAKNEVKNHSSILEFARKIEEKLPQLNKEAHLSFPINLSMNEIAAHDSARFNDKRELHGLLKIDLGVEFHGAMGDNALSVDIDSDFEGIHEIISASKNALESATKQLEKGVFEIDSLSDAMYEEITKLNLQPIRNLTGHGLALGKIHDEPNIPAINIQSNKVLLNDSFFAIEPFATNGRGYVNGSGQAEIYSLSKVVPVRTTFASQVQKFIRENYMYRPFSKRWIIEKFGEGKTNLAFRELMLKNALTSYEPLHDINLVSQHEYCFGIIDNKVIKLSQYDD
jgi:methionyl aminopeptidase